MDLRTLISQHSKLFLLILVFNKLEHLKLWHLPHI